jgi:putative addiction module component (TIGR02574 family)
MSPTFQALGIDRMAIPDRIKLVQEIWDSIAAERTAPLLSEAQRQELRKRVAEDDAAPDEVIPWEQVKAQTLARLQP